MQFFNLGVGSKGLFLLYYRNSQHTRERQTRPRPCRCACGQREPPRSESAGGSVPVATKQIMSTEKRAAISSFSLRRWRGAFDIQRFYCRVDVRQGGSQQCCFFTIFGVKLSQCVASHQEFFRPRTRAFTGVHPPRLTRTHRQHEGRCASSGSTPVPLVQTV